MVKILERNPRNPFEQLLGHRKKKKHPTEPDLWMVTVCFNILVNVQARVFPTFSIKSTRTDTSEDCLWSLVEPMPLTNMAVTER